MPSKDTVPFHITKSTADEIEKIRSVISEEFGIPLDRVTKKHAEIAMREKSKKGKLLVNDLNKILLGQIR